MEPVLKAEDLVKVFRRPGLPDLTAVDHVSFALQPGECLGLIGESGSGKTTIASLLTRLSDVTSGHIYLEGEEITRLKGRRLREAYRKMQMVFQSPQESFDPRRTLKDGIGESLRSSGWTKERTEQRVEALLKQCGLTSELAGRYPHQVSGGQCQRAAIARAIAIGPKILICDEATSALDVTVQKEIIELLGELRTAKGKDLSVLFISHDIALVQQFCDRVLVLHHGKIVEEGDPDAIIRSPENEYTKQLIESVL